MCRRRLRRTGSSPWYPGIREELRDAKQSRRRAERQWLTTGLTVRKQLYSAAKRFVATSVVEPSPDFFRPQVANGSCSKQLFKCL